MGSTQMQNQGIKERERKRENQKGRGERVRGLAGVEPRGYHPRLTRVLRILHQRSNNWVIFSASMAIFLGWAWFQLNNHGLDKRERESRRNEGAARRLCVKTEK